MKPDKKALPFPTPKELGYMGNRQAVMFYWEPGGDELAIFDGQTLTVGFGNNEVFLKWFRDNGIPMSALKIGDSDTEAVNAIVYDMTKDQVMVIGREEAYTALRGLFLAEVSNG